MLEAVRWAWISWVVVFAWLALVVVMLELGRRQDCVSSLESRGGLAQCDVCKYLQAFVFRAASRQK